jgi:choline-glycine betaine transporter
LPKENLTATSQVVLDWVMENTGWLFVALSSLFVVYVLWLAVSRFGNIPLGKDAEKPEYSMVSWVSMMFAAGMGIGLMFYGVAEPLYHYISPPPGTVDGQTPAAVQTAMATSMASRTEAVGDDALRTWMSGWTIFYWAWWVSWTPFVGLFIARISRGRTIRQFVTGVLLVPSVVSVIWFGIFGGAAINIQSTADATPDTGDGLAKIVNGTPTISFDGALFDLLHHLPLPSAIAGAVAVLAMVLVAIFFVTGADAASIVMGSLSSNGVEEPRRGVVIFWGALTGAVAAVMLLAGGDKPAEALAGLQRITIVSALPFVVVMFLMCFSLTRDLRRDPLSLRRRLVTSVVERSIRSGIEQHGGVQFDLVTKHECDERCAKSELDPSGDNRH